MSTPGGTTKTAQRWKKREPDVEASDAWPANKHQTAKLRGGPAIRSTIVLGE